MINQRVRYSKSEFLRNTAIRYTEAIYILTHISYIAVYLFT